MFKGAWEEWRSAVAGWSDMEKLSRSCRWTVLFKSIISRLIASP